MKLRKLKKQVAANNEEKRIRKSKSRTHGDDKIRSDHRAADALKPNTRVESSPNFLFEHPNSNGQYHADNYVKKPGPQPRSSTKSDKHTDNVEERGKAKRIRKDFFQPGSAITPNSQNGPPPGAEQSGQPQKPPRQAQTTSKAEFEAQFQKFQKPRTPSCTVVSGDYSCLPPRSPAAFGDFLGPPPGVPRYPFAPPPIQKTQAPSPVIQRKQKGTQNKPGKPFVKEPLSAEFQPYTPDQLTSSGTEYMAEASKDPIGWKKDDIILALSHGYSKTGLCNLRPNSRCWTLGLLLDNRATHAPDVLDPRLKSFQVAYVGGYTMKRSVTCQVLL